jgi:hypothetical protein
MFFCPACRLLPTRKNFFLKSTNKNVAALFIAATFEKRHITDSHISGQELKNKIFNFFAMPENPYFSRPQQPLGPLLTRR